MSNRIVALRTHSWYSLLEGVASPADLLACAAEQGYDALALTDTTLAGAVELMDAAKGCSVRPILGARLRQGGQSATVLICEPAGYRSLCQIVTRLNLQEGKVSLPLLLADASEGLHVLIDDANMLKPPLTSMRGRLWLEVVRPARSDQHERALIEAGARLGCKPVASLACHLARREDHRVYRLVTAIRQGTTLDALPAKLPVTGANHLVDAAEMRERFRDLPNALHNAVLLAESCRSDVLPRGQTPPPVRLPQGQEPIGHLRSLCEQALVRRPPRDLLAARRRLEVELALIADRDLAAYFLAVGEIGEEARRQGWPLALRGSAAASLVLYLLGLGDTDPLLAGLRIERFLHPGRADLPDIDLECADAQRKAVFAWLLKRHGRDHVARVGSRKHFRARSALKAAALANGLPEAQAAELVESLDLQAAGALADERLALTPPAWPLEPDSWPRVLAAARALDGRPRELTYHPSGVVLSAEVIDTLTPSERGPGDVRVAQYDAEAIERVGLLKLDILSSHALTVVAAARQHLQALDPQQATQSAEDADAAVAALLCAADTVGIGQLETPGQRRLLRQAGPKSLAELMCCLAVARPGAASAGGREAFLRRRHGLERPSYPAPELEPVLRDSFGVLLFEDDALAVIEALTGLPAPEADRLRLLLADEGTAPGAAVELLAACERNSTPRAAAEAALPHLKKFANYSFCKAHAATVARVAWTAAWLKARHPLAFWTATLNHHGERNYSAWVHVEEAKRAGLLVLPPCINRSRADWTQEVTALRAGLAAIRTLGGSALLAVIEERERSGPFASLAELRRRLHGQIAPQDLALLIRCGACDAWGRGREVLLREAEAGRHGRLPDGWKTKHAPLPWPLAGLDTSPTAGRMAEEWDLLGFAPGPPLLSLARRLLPGDLHDSRALPALAGRKVRLAGLVAHCQEGNEGRPTSALTLLDEHGLGEVTLPVGVEAPGEAELVLVEGTVEVQHGAPLVRASRVSRVLPGTVPVAGQFGAGAAA